MQRTDLPADDRRFRSLDALRGVAALSVVFLHVSNIYADTFRSDFQGIAAALKLFAVSPLGFLIEGSQAVLVFFVLSGFVLTLMLERPISYAEYAARRFARLYIPYIASVAVAVVLIQCFGSRQLPDQSKWMNQFLGVTVTPTAVLDHVLFIGAYDTAVFNFVIWSLVQEMRISLLFPFLLAGVKRFGVVKSLAVSLAVSFVAVPIFYYIDRRTTHQTLGNLPLTFHYILFFVTGICLALHRQRLAAWYAGLTTARRALLAIAALCLYVLPPNTVYLLHVKTGMLYQWLEWPAIAFLIVASINSPWLRRLLATAPLVWLGRVSFSLYLFHGIILVEAMNLFYEKVDTGLIVAGCLVASLVAAEIGYRLIEHPAIALSHRWAQAIRKRRLAQESVEPTR